MTLGSKFLKFISLNIHRFNESISPIIPNKVLKSYEGARLNRKYSPRKTKAMRENSPTMSAYVNHYFVFKIESSNLERYSYSRFNSTSFIAPNN